MLGQNKPSYGRHRRCRHDPLVTSICFQPIPGSGCCHVSMDVTTHLSTLAVCVHFSMDCRMHPTRPVSLANFFGTLFMVLMKRSSSYKPLFQSAQPSVYLQLGNDIVGNETKVDQTFCHVITVIPLLSFRPRKSKIHSCNQIMATCVQHWISSIQTFTHIVYIRIAIEQMPDVNLYHPSCGCTSSDW